jgi:hypothetical protein
VRFKLACVLILISGCGEEGPPLDELPLRDALRADPQVVAAMSDERRARLAARLEAARAVDVASDPVAAEGDASALVTELDAARARRSAEPLIVGEIRGGNARATAADRGYVDTTPLPPLEPAADVTPLEARALAGAAGSSVRAVLAASGARNLRRVVGWPIGAVALGDTAYVNGAWLAALARADAADAGADASAAPGAGIGATPVAASTSTTAMPPAPEPASVEARAAPAGISPASPRSSPDGGVYAPAPPPSDGSGDACASFGDSCVGSSEDDSCGDDDGGDSCDDGGDDGGGDACSGGDDAGDACGGADADPSCQISRGRHRGRTGRNPAVTLFGPLAFLLTRRQR